MGVGLELDTVQTRLTTSGSGIGVRAHDAVHVPFLGNLRESAVRGFTDRRRCDDRKPVAVVIARASAQVGDLAHHGCAVLVHAVGQLSKPRHDLVLVDMQVAERGGAVRGDDGGATHHGQPDAALGLLLVIEAVAPLGHAVLGV